MAELKGANKGIEEAKPKEGIFRYQVYYQLEHEQHARQLLSDGLAKFLEAQATSWQEKDCSFANLEPTVEEDRWGALRLDVGVNSKSSLIKLRQAVKAEMEAQSGLEYKVRTKMPNPKSQLYRMKAEAEWNGQLKDAIEYVTNDK